MSLVRVLEVVHYPLPGSRWETLTHRDPSWQEIESAIGQLDRDVYPYLWLHLAEPIEGEMPENALCVMGGRGEYAIFQSLAGHAAYYRDDRRGDAVVQIWESDQGSSQPESSLCNDLALVLAIAKHFAETGELYPGVAWET